MKRRDFLKMSGTGLAFLGPGVSLVTAFVQSMLNEAFAEASSKSFYITMAASGGPPRWMFDAPLNMNNDPNFPIRQDFGTKFHNLNDGFGMEYATSVVNGIRLPYLWGSEVPSISGGTRPLSELAMQGLFVRGYSFSGTHTHRGNGNLSPSLNSHSLHSIPALDSNLPLPIVIASKSGQLHFRAIDGGTKVNFNVKGGIGGLFDAFSIGDNGANLSFNSLNQGLETQLNAALDSVEQSGILKSNGQKALFKDRKRAMQIFRIYNQALIEEFDEILEKYENLIKRTIREHRLDGIDTAAIISDGTSRFANGKDRVINQGVNVTDYLTNYGHNNGLAKSFAIAEFLVKNNISSSINLPAASRAIYFENDNNPPGGSPGTNSGHDSHDLGSVLHLLFYTKYWQAVGASLLELSDSLTETNQWHKTFVHLFGDFGRKPQGISGSTHGASCTSVSIYSGLINSPIVIGNTKYKNNLDYGEAAPLESLGGKPIRRENMSSSVASLLDGPSPTSRDPAVFIRSGDQILSVCDPPTTFES